MNKSSAEYINRTNNFVTVERIKSQLVISGEVLKDNKK